LDEDSQLFILYINRVIASFVYLLLQYNGNKGLSGLNFSDTIKFSNLENPCLVHDYRQYVLY